MNHAVPGNCAATRVLRVFSYPDTMPSRPQPETHAHDLTDRPSTIRASAVKSILAAIALTFAVVAFGVSASPASAANIPCWKALINDWFDGRIDEVYEKHCYSEAIAHLPRDVEQYSEAKDDILRAQLDAIRDNKEPTYDEERGAGGTTGPSGGGDDDGSKGVITRAIEWLGPSNADAVPLPLLILAGVALLLLAAAGSSFLSRRLQARRLPPPDG
jgi:hypothetical protein